MRSPNPDDKKTWHQAVRDVTPLGGRKRPDFAAAQDPPAPESGEEDYEFPRDLDRVPAVSEPPASPGTAAPPRGSGGKSDPGTYSMDRNTRERLHKGKIEPDGKLDLHGRRYDAAQSAFEDFLAHHIKVGSRMVLVVTGRGGKKLSSERPAPGVLRESFYQWVTASPHRTSIIYVCQAHRDHGGEGAFYIWLKKSHRRGGKARGDSNPGPAD